MYRNIYGGIKINHLISIKSPNLRGLCLQEVIGDVLQAKMSYKSIYCYEVKKYVYRMSATGKFFSCFP